MAVRPASCQKYGRLRNYYPLFLSIIIIFPFTSITRSSTANPSLLPILFLSTFRFPYCGYAKVGRSYVQT